MKGVALPASHTRQGTKIRASKLAETTRSRPAPVKAAVLATEHAETNQIPGEKPERMQQGTEQRCEAE